MVCSLSFPGSFAGLQHSLGGADRRLLKLLPVMLWTLLFDDATRDVGGRATVVYPLSLVPLLASAPYAVTMMIEDF